MKPVLYVVLVALLAFGIFSWCFAPEEVPSVDKGSQVGGERDEHGCLVAAGYSYSDEVVACLREFDMTPDIKEAARLAVASVGAGYALTVVSFNSYEEAGAYDITLERGEERVSETVYIRGGVVVPKEVVEKADLVQVTSPAPGATITSPVAVRGMARGMWYFEASFPIVIVDWDGKIIGEGYATASDDWMTEDFVPFVGEVSYTLPADTPYHRGAIIFKKDNPSGLPEHDDALELPVSFE